MVAIKRKKEKRATGKVNEKIIPWVSCSFLVRRNRVRGWNLVCQFIAVGCITNLYQYGRIPEFNWRGRWKCRINKWLFSLQICK